MLELRAGLSLELPTSEARHGRGLFETILVRGGRALRLDWHLERLASGAAYLGLEAPPRALEVEAFAGRLGLEGLAEGVLRLFAVDGLLALDLSSGLPPLPASREADLSRNLRRWSGSPLCRFKTLSYLENAELGREAEARGLLEVVALNEGGRLTDGGRTSLFVQIGGELLTPPVSEGALPGTLRRLILERGLAREAPLAPADLEGAEAAFLTNALRLVLPLEAFGTRRLDPEAPLVSEARALALAESSPEASRRS